MKRYATKINIIQSPSAAKRKGEGYGVIRVQTHKGIYIVSGESIHCQPLTEDVDCSSGKDAYPTYAAAKRAFLMKAENGKRSKRIYRCKECGCYHFTTNDGASRRRRPYSREREKKYAKIQMLPVLGLSESVSAAGFSMKRFRNKMSKPKMAI